MTDPRVKSLVEGLDLTKPLPPDPDPDTGDKPRRYPLPRSAFCSGQVAERKDGHLICPGCGECVDPNCSGIRKEAK